MDLTELSLRQHSCAVSKVWVKKTRSTRSHNAFWSIPGLLCSAEYISTPSPPVNPSGISKLTWTVKLAGRPLCIAELQFSSSPICNTPGGTVADVVWWAGPCSGYTLLYWTASTGCCSLTAVGRSLLCRIKDSVNCCTFDGGYCLPQRSREGFLCKRGDFYCMEHVL